MTNQLYTTQFAAADIAAIREWDGRINNRPVPTLRVPATGAPDTASPLDRSENARIAAETLKRDAGIMALPPGVR